MARQVFDDEKKQLIPLDQAISESVFQRQFSELKVEFKNDLKEQRGLMWQIVIGVGVAFIFAIGLAVFDSIYFHSGGTREWADLKDDIDSKYTELRLKQNDLEHRCINWQK